MYLSKADLNKHSEEIFNLYMRLPKVKLMGGISKVDPFIVVENLVKLDIDYRHLSDNRSIFGVTSYSPTIYQVIPDGDEENNYWLDGKTVLIEKDLVNNPVSKGKYHFTLVHEASHHILKQMFPGEYGCGNVAKSAICYRYYERGPKKITDWEEWQATALASGILMPEAILRKNMKEAGLKEYIDVLPPGSSNDLFKKLCRIAELMGVSVTALRIRMNDLGIIGKDMYYDRSAFFSGKGN